MSHIFISYSRKDINFAQKIVGALATHNLDIWIDLESIPKGEKWLHEIYEGIERADAFLFLISPDSAKSENCNKEIVHAVKNKKRIIPIVVRDTDSKPIPSVISERNWIFCRYKEGEPATLIDNFDAAIQEIYKTIHTDHEWLKYHTKLQVKALDWNNRKDRSRLLRGKELREAEEQLTKAGVQKDPQPTDLHRSYILSSQRNESQQRRRITLSLVSGLLIVIVFAVLAWTQSQTAVVEGNSRATAESLAFIESNARATALVNEANANATALSEKIRAAQQSNVARAGELAAQAIFLRETNLELSFLLGIESFQKADIASTRGALLDNTQFKQQLVQIFYRNSQTISAIAFSPDGNTIAAGDHGQQVIFWDVKTGQRTGVPLTGFPMWVSKIGFSPDGKILACKSSNIISLWNVDTQQKTGEFFVSNYPIDTFAFSPGGRQLVSVGCSKMDAQNKCKERELIFWDINSLKFTRKTAIKSGDGIDDLVYSPDGKTLIAAGRNNSIMFWDVSTRDGIYKSITGNSPVAFSPDGKTLAFSSNDNSIVLLNTEDYSPVGEPLKGHTGPLNKMIFSQGGRNIESLSIHDDSIRIWDVTSHQQIKLITGQENGIRPFQDYLGIGSEIAFSPDGNTFASTARTYDTVDLWSLNPTNPISHKLIGDKRIYSIAFSPNGEYLASTNGRPESAGWISDTSLWDLTTLELIGQIPTQNSSSVMFSAGGNELLSGIGRYSILKWNMSTLGTSEQPLEDGSRSGVYTNGAFSPNGAYYALPSLAEIKLWDVVTGKTIKTDVSGHTDVVESIAFSPDSSILASGGQDKTIILWSMIDHKAIGKPLMLDEDNSNIYSLAFSPSGKTLASASFSITLWDLTTKRPFSQLKRSNELSRSLAFAPDGTILASGNWDGSIVLWEVSTGQPLGQPLLGHTSPPISMIFSPDGNTLASGSWDNNIILWDMDPQSWIRKICQRVGRNFTQAEWTQYFPGEEYRITCPQWTAGE